jgi:integrase
MDEGKLTALVIEKLLPQQTDYKKTDGRGIQLVISTSGEKWWRYDYQWVGKNKSISLGSYPRIDLNKVRQQRKVFEDLIDKNIDPAAHRESWAAQNDKIDTLTHVSNEWLASRSKTMSEQLKAKTTVRLKNDILPALGNRPIRNISRTIILELIKAIENKGQVDKAHRTRQTIQKIFEYALKVGIIRHNPTINLRNSQLSLVTRHYKYVEAPEGVAQLIRGISTYRGYIKTRLALEFGALVFVRPTQLVHAKWSEIDFEEKEWSIEINGTRHVVPLATQMLKILMQAKPPTNLEGFIFHNRKSRHLTLSANTLNHALKSITKNVTQITVWGFQSMARQHLTEMGWSKLALKSQLQADQGVEDILQKDIGYTYRNLLLERKSMMQAWANYLDALKDGGDRLAMHGAIRIKNDTH